MSFFTRPSLEDRQFKQLSGTTLTLSGDTTIANTGSLSVNGNLILNGKQVLATGGTLGDVLTLDIDGKIKLMAPTGSGGTANQYYNGSSPATVSVGGITVGTVLTGKTFEELFEELLVPYQTPTFSSFTVQGQSQTVEVSTVLSGNRTFLWSTSNSTNVQSNSIKIVDVNTSSNLATGLANDGSEVVAIASKTFITPGTQSWRVEGTDTNGNPFVSSNFTVTAIYPYFYGKTNSASRPTANNALVTGGTKVIASSTGTITINFNSTDDDYIWFAIPSTSSNKTVWYVNALNQGSIGGSVSPGGNLFPDPTTVAVSTVNWGGVNYKVYVSNYKTSVTTNMELRNS